MRIIYFFMISIAELMYDYATRIQYATEIQRKRPVKNWSLSPAVDNVIARNFKTATPDEKWITDISEHDVRLCIG